VTDLRNRLADSTSPYLRQHAQQPVAWQPWDAEALAAARRLERPIFLSVGYSTCHWCHVMAHESFDDPAVAAVMNDLFVNIKVDREELPDVDRVYMAFVQASTGRGGWPMSVWMTPELAPFCGGTYFPPQDRWGTPGFVRVCQGVAGFWRDRRSEATARGEEILRRLDEDEPPIGVVPPEVRAACATYMEQCRRAWDDDTGGFGGAPKFPRPAALLALADLAGDGRLGPDDRAWAAAVCDRAVQAFDEGGIHDHLGGGLHRYSVDAAWRVPHFEKMLYDQGQVLELAARRGALDNSAAVALAEDIVAYVDHCLSLPGGPCAAAEDADSARPDGSHGEGAFYVWDAAEFRRIVEEQAGAQAAELAAHVWGVDAAGNAPEGSDPHGEFTGLNVLYRAFPVVDAAHRLGLTPAAGAALLEQARLALHTAREQRSRPHRDDKVVASWNGYYAAGLARAGVLLQRPAWVARAQEIVLWCRQKLWDGQALRRSWLDRPGPGQGQAVDYAALADAALALHTADGAQIWLDWAQELMAALERHCVHPAGGWYDGPASPEIRLRSVEEYEGAEPSAAGLAVRNCLQLAALLGDEAWRQRAEAALAARHGLLERQPFALPGLLRGLALAAEGVPVLAVAGPGADLAPLLGTAAARLPALAVLRLDDPSATGLLARHPHLAGLSAPASGLGAWLCLGRRCLPGVSSAAALAAAIDALSTPA
jgi:hypothetical protein